MKFRLRYTPLFCISFKKFEYISLKLVPKQNQKFRFFHRTQLLLSQFILKQICSDFINIFKIWFLFRYTLPIPSCMNHVCNAWKLFKKTSQKESEYISIKLKPKQESKCFSSSYIVTTVVISFQTNLFWFK